MEAAQAFSQRRRLRLGALLLRSGLLSPEQLAEALEEKERTGDRIGEIVVRNGWVTEEAVARTLADQFAVEFVDLAKEPPEARAESLLSNSVAHYFRGVPVRFLDPATVLFAVSDPTAFSLDDVRGAIGLEVQLAVATDSAIAAALARLEPDPPDAVRGAPSEPILTPEPQPAPEPSAELPVALELDPGPAIARVGGLAPTSEPVPDLTADAPEPVAPAAAVLVEPRPAVPPEAPAAGGADSPPADTPTEAVSAVEAASETPEQMLELEPLRIADAGPAHMPSEEGLAPAPPAEHVSEPPPELADPLEREPELLAAPEPMLHVEPQPIVHELPGERESVAELEPASAFDAGIAPVDPAGESIALPAAPPIPEPEPEPAPQPALQLEPEPIAAEPPAQAEPMLAPHAAIPPLDPAEELLAPPAATPDASSSEAPGLGEPIADAASAMPALRIVSAPEPTSPAPPVALPDDPSAPQPSQVMSAMTVAPATLPGSEAPAPGTDVVPLFEHRRPQLGTLLLRASLVTANQLAEALEEKEETGERLGEILLRRGWLGEKALAQALADQHGLQYYDLAGTPPNAAVATLLPEKYARRYRAIPIRFVGDTTLLVAVADPTDVLASDDLRIALGAAIELAVATPSEIQAALDRLFPASAEAPEAASSVELESESPSGLRRGETIDVMDPSQSAPAVELVNEVIRRAVQEGASDIHFEPQAERLLVRIRVDGVMREMRIVPQSLQQAVGARLKVMSELDIAERRVPQDGRITIKFGGKPVDLRVAVMPTTFGEQVVVRILYRGSNLATLEDLGLDHGTREAITSAIHEPYGMVISVGPTGSGKTTTLYAALAMLNTQDRCLMTIEDPVEYQIPGINQIQVNVKAGLTFAQGLRTILRSDPDVLLVGEIRDSETAKIGVQAAMTGHLVLSTLHADNVGSAISRLADMGVERQLLASTINCLFAQRLARRLCTSCKEEYTVDPEMLHAEGADARLIPDVPVTVYRACGCPQCFGGYKGRVGLFETLTVTPRMRRMFETATAEEIYEAAVASGMRTLQDDGLRLVLAGATSVDEIRRVAGTRRI